MVPWNKLPEDLQKAILTMVIVFGGASASCQLGPAVCDPAPPPATTPMICDPPPPPATPPPPTTTATITPTITSTSIPTPMICDPPPPPSLTPMICDPAPPPSPATMAPDQHSSVQGVAIGAWEESREGSQTPLPLAEIRTVEIVWEVSLEPATDSGLCFVAQTPWSGARYRWSVSGGRLIEAGAMVTWEPPAKPGRYLLQVVADWDWAGLAVDALVLAVQEDGSMILGI